MPAQGARARPTARARRQALGAAAALLGALVPAVAAIAQPADLPIPPATTTKYPPGVKVARTPAGAVYTDVKGRTLYGMDMRVLLRWGPDPAQYCQAECAKLWEPLLAASSAKPNIAFPKGAYGNAQAPGFIAPANAPDWTVIAGAQGPQWVYKGWHMVFARKGDPPGSTAFDGADEYTWNTLKFVPPVPQVVAPGTVSLILVDGNHAFADAEGRVLFGGTCTADCDRWAPLPAGLGSRGRGEWTVSRSGDVAQWLYRGKPVFVSQEDDKTSVPPGAVVLRP